MSFTVLKTILGTCTFVNASSPFPTTLSEASGDSINAHQFLGRLIEKAAQIEGWAVARHRAAAPKENPPLMIGQRMAAAACLAEKRPELFNDAKKALKLINRAEPFLKLGSALAHATLCRPEGDLLVFQAVDTSAETPWLGRIALRRAELSAILNGINEVANGLKQQTPKP